MSGSSNVRLMTTGEPVVVLVETGAGPAWEKLPVATSFVVYHPNRRATAPAFSGLVIRSSVEQDPRGR